LEKLSKRKKRTKMDNVIELKTGLVRKSFFKESKIDVIKLESIKLKHIIGIDFTDQEKTIENIAIVASRLSGLSLDEIKELGLEDWKILSERIEKIIVKAMGIQ